MSATKILFNGLDWLEVTVKFDEELSHNAYLKSVHKIFNSKPDTLVNFLGKDWSVHLVGNNGYRRYLQNSKEGITVYVDNRSWNGIGNAWPLRIVLRKPSCPDEGGRISAPLLWESPFESMKDILERIYGFYGEVTHSVARVDVCVHWSNSTWQPCLEDYSNFVTRIKNPTPIPDYQSSSPSQAGAFIFGKPKRNNINNSVTATIYNINRRLKDLPKSFDPTQAYSEKVSTDEIETIWNTEFKVWTRFLKKRGLDTLEQLEVGLPKLWWELTTKVVTLRYPDSKDSKRSRWEIAPLWKDIQNAFGKELTIPPRPFITSTPRGEDEIIKRISGLAKDYTALNQNWENLSPEQRRRAFMLDIPVEWFSDDEIRVRSERKDLNRVISEATGV